MNGFDVAIIGGGIIGNSAAAYLAEQRLSVVLLERTELGAGASGRNSGAIQHPFDQPFANFHNDSLTLYRELADDGFTLPRTPAGILLLSPDESAVAAVAAQFASEWPELQPTALATGAAAAMEPALDGRLAACRVETGYPIAPADATLAFARRAERAGTVIRVGESARPAIVAGRVVGVDLADGSRLACSQVLIAAGPWSPGLVPGWDVRPPIRWVWGVVVATSLPEPPGPILEELEIGNVSAREGRLFSLVSVGGTSTVGSTFIEQEPDVSALATEIVERGARFVPGLARAPVTSVRACARPVSFDGRPLIGAIPTVERLFICAGHGPWGISTGPASARLVADQMLGLADELAEFSPRRWSATTEFA